VIVTNAYTLYWEKVLEFARYAPPAQNKKLWEYLGVTIETTRPMVNVSEDKNYPAYDTSTLPASDETMAAIAYACGVQRLQFNERALKNVVKEATFRKVLKDFQDKGYTKKAKKGSALELNGKGKLRLYAYLSPTPMPSMRPVERP